MQNSQTIRTIRGKRPNQRSTSGAAHQSRFRSELAELRQLTASAKQNSAFDVANLWSGIFTLLALDVFTILILGMKDTVQFTQIVQDARDSLVALNAPQTPSAWQWGGLLVWTAFLAIALLFKAGRFIDASSPKFSNITSLIASLWSLFVLSGLTIWTIVWILIDITSGGIGLRSVYEFARWLIPFDSPEVLGTLLAIAGGLFVLSVTVAYGTHSSKIEFDEHDREMVSVALHELEVSLETHKEANSRVRAELKKFEAALKTLDKMCANLEGSIGGARPTKEQITDERTWKAYRSTVQRAAFILRYVGSGVIKYPSTEAAKGLVKLARHDKRAIISLVGKMNDLITDLRIRVEFVDEEVGEYAYGSRQEEVPTRAEVTGWMEALSGAHGPADELQAVGAEALQIIQDRVIRLTDRPEQRHRWK